MFILIRRPQPDAEVDSMTNSSTENVLNIVRGISSSMKQILPVIVIILIALLLTLLFAGCNTIEGIGKDIEAIGQGTSEVAKDVNPYEEK